MSCIDTGKISNKNAMKKTIEYKSRLKKSKNKIIFNTMIDLDKFKNKKISKSKSSSTIITKKKYSEKKIKKQRRIFIPINLGGPLIKTYNTKKKIEYNKSASDIISNNPLKGFSNKNYNNFDYEYKNERKSQRNTINYIINNFNLSLKKKDKDYSHRSKQTKEFKGFNRSLISSNNNQCVIKNNNNINYINNIKYEELKKENENLILVYEEKLKENKKHKNKINYLENKNSQIIKKVDKIKKENEKYSKILEKVLKVLKKLKNNGLNVEEILENLSETEEDELDNNSNSDDFDENSSFNSKKSTINNIEMNSNFSHFKSEAESIPSNNNKTNKIYKRNKSNVKDNNIPKLDMKKIYNNNDTPVEGKKLKKNKHKNYSHSVGK